MYVYTCCCGLSVCFQRELRGSQGLGVVGNNWFDCGLPSLVYTFKPSCLTDAQAPFLGY